jgi:hypothetical protein
MTRWKRIARTLLDYGAEQDVLVCEIGNALQHLYGPRSDIEMAYIADYLGLSVGIRH